MSVAPVSVVIVNYNRADMLVECVESVLSQTAAPAEVIVVDNGSADGSARAVRDRFGGSVRVIELGENLGFAGGNNIGIKEAGSEWIALINNDAAVDPEWLAEMMEEASGPDVGLVACRIIRAGQRDLLDNIGVELWPDGMSRGGGHFRMDAETNDPGVFIPSGCAALVRRSAFEEAGGFEEAFFAYSEDTDLFIKIRLLGYKCAFASRAAVYHAPGGGTLGVISPDKIYLVERNRISVLFRFYPIGNIILSPLYTLIRYAGLLAAIFRSRRSGPFSVPQGPDAGTRGLGVVGLIPSLVGLLRAYKDGLLRIRGDLGVRREWKSKMRVPSGSMKLWIKKHRLDLASLLDLEPK